MTTPHHWRSLRAFRLRDRDALANELAERHQSLADIAALRLSRTLWRPFGAWAAAGPVDAAPDGHHARLAALRERPVRRSARPAAGKPVVVGRVVETPAPALAPARPASAPPRRGFSDADLLMLAYEFAEALDEPVVESAVLALPQLDGAELVARIEAGGATARCLASLILIGRQAGVEGVFEAARRLALRPVRLAELVCIRALQRKFAEQGGGFPADALLCLAWAMGDAGFFRRAQPDSASTPRAAQLLPFTLPPLLATPQGLVEARRPVAARKVMVVIDAMTSPGLVADLARGARQVTVVATQKAIRQGADAALCGCLTAKTRARFLKLVESFATLYSPEEEKLSARTQTIAQATVDALGDIDAGTSPDLALLRQHRDSFALRIDDTLFNAAIGSWAAAAAARALDPDVVVVVSDDGALATGLRGLFDAQGLTAPILAQGPLDNPLDADVEALREEDKLGRTTPDAKTLARELAGVLRAGTSHPFGAAQAPAGTLIVGRPGDRNFVADITALGQAFRAHGRVALAPSALRASDGATLRGIVEAAVPQTSRDLILMEPFEAAAALKRAETKALVAGLADAIMPAVAARCDELERAVLMLGRDAFRRLVNRAIPGMVLTLGRCAALFEASPPERVIAMPSRDWISRMVIGQARARGIPTYDVQTVFIGRRSRYKPTAAETQIVIDTFSAGIFNSFLGMPKSRILLAGSVKYGASRNAILAADGAPVRALLAGRERVVLFAVSPALEDCGPVAEALAAIVRARPALGLAIKLHPSCDELQERAYEAIAAALPPRAAIVLPRSGLDVAVAAADIVVTRFSNVGFEAALVGLPVVACNFSGAALPAPLEDMGIAIRAGSPAELAAALDDVLADGPLKAALAVTRHSYLRKNRHLLSSTLPADMAAKIVERERKARLAPSTGAAEAAAGRSRRPRKGPSGKAGPPPARRRPLEA